LSACFKLARFILDLNHFVALQTLLGRHFFNMAFHAHFVNEVIEKSAILLKYHYYRTDVRL
jgi:hypothetical protein